MTYLQLSHLFKAYGSQMAVQDINLSIQKGELVSLLGPSGCGKTTILRMVAGFERPTGGTIELDGEKITYLPANRRDTGMVFQSYSLFPHMTVSQNIAFGLRLKRLSKAAQRSRVHEMLELVGLTGLNDRFPHQLSGGQQQRVALARAMAISPRVLLLDEPLSALDAKVRLQLRNEIRRIQQQLKITTLFVTHDQEEALSISDRVIVMSEGKIEQEGTPEEIYLMPSTPFTASFIGAMNQIQGIWRNGSVDITENAIDRSEILPLKVKNTEIQNAVQNLEVQNLENNTPVVVLIRPENIVVLNDGDLVTEMDNTLKGLIASRTFLGSVIRLSILIGNFYLNVDVSTARASQFQSGQVIQLHLPPEHCRVLAQSFQAVHSQSQATLPQVSPAN